MKSIWAHRFLKSDWPAAHPTVKMPLQTNCFRQQPASPFPQQTQEASQIRMWSDLLSAGWLASLPPPYPALILSLGDREMLLLPAAHPPAAFRATDATSLPEISSLAQDEGKVLCETVQLYFLGFVDQKHELYWLLFVYMSKCYSTVYTNIFLKAGSCKTTTWVIFRLLRTAAVQK